MSKLKLNSLFATQDLDNLYNELDICDLIKSARGYAAHDCIEIALMLYQKAENLLPQLEHLIACELKQLKKQ